MEPEHQSKGRAWVQSYAQSSQYVGAGIQMAVSIFLCLLGGNWLDQQWGISPLLLILGVFVGGGVGFYNLLKILTGADRRKREEAKACGKG